MTDVNDETNLTTEETPTEEVIELTPDQETALAFLGEVSAASGLEMHPEVRSIQAPYLNIELVGEDMRLTFGRMGQGLDALQFLVNLIVSRRIASDVRVVLDAADYRSRRVEALTRKAVELANEVKARNEEAELEPLPAHERRIVHAALADDPEITTYSEGDEPDRRIVISPRR